MTTTAHPGPLRLLVIQPTPYCNLDCDYCYLPNRDDRRRLSLDVLDRALHRVLSSDFIGESFTLLWHAGEPLTMPASFYDAATERIQAALAQHGLPLDTISQSLQTNGIGISKNWCECLQRNDIHVGVSLDGPAFLHDLHRRTRTHQPSHAAVMRGIHLLQEHGIPFNVITVLSDASLDHADALYDFYAENGIRRVGFNMEETEGVNHHSSLDQPGTEERYRSFMRRFWHRCALEPGRVMVREFEGLTSLIASDERLLGTDMNQPFAIVNIDAQGNISTFDPELLSVSTDRFGDFIFGNVFDSSLAAILDTQKFKVIQQEIAAGVEACRASCDHFGICGGGAGSNKYWEHGRFDGTETQHCRYRVKLVAEVVLSGMESALGLTEPVPGPPTRPASPAGGAVLQAAGCSTSSGPADGHGSARPA